jgi:hypothetical protein
MMKFVIGNSVISVTGIFQPRQISDWMDSDNQNDDQYLPNAEAERVAKEHIHELDPALYTAEEVQNYLANKAKSVNRSTSYIDAAIIDAAIGSELFPWGKLIFLKWHELGFAPGGTEYCILANGLPALTLGFQRLNWNSIEIKPS